jgi:uncharacterized protein
MNLSSAKSKSSLKIFSKQTFSQLKEKADEGQMIAQFALACCYAQGKGVERSLSEAIKYYQMAADQGVEDAWLPLGDIHKAEGLEELAQQCYQGAFNYYKKSAEHNNAASQAIIGTFFENGIGTPVDLQEAVNYYRLSANQKNPRGQYLLGRCYEYGHGVEQSIENAIHYYKLSAEQDYPLAEYNLGLCLLNNDNVKGVDYLQLLIQRNSSIDSAIKADCYYHLGLCFEEGKGVKQSNKEALHYLKLASHDGNAGASNRLAEAYQNGDLGLERSPKKAFHFFQLATDQGHLFSALSLGHCFEFGLGVEPSIESALHYYELASRQGMSEGSTRLKACQKKLIKKSDV